MNQKILWWMMGIIGAVLLALGGAWANGMYTAVDKVSMGVDKTNSALVETNKELRNLVSALSERVVKVETYNEIQRQQMSDLQRQLTRVETKVDELGKDHK